MAGPKALSACILIFLIVSSGATSGEARRLLEETRPGEEASCAGGCHGLAPVLPGGGGLTPAAATKMATTDGRPTTPGHSPGIGNKIAGNTR
ncbi:hypothetical protein HU200_001115 [Digitaria exilis]|uniref:Uncharacterized protein n=1 Tax=Digitaria exilis TaxID=1010633 RepID=A0A835L0Q9_9POAL|nr:hypothetical protein HU200_001115 [Digitaria exilis]